MPRPPLRKLFARAFALRCPNCGSRGVFKSWFKMQPACPQCGLAFERGENEDYWLGGYMFNLVASELIYISIVVAFIVWSWPDVPWTLIEVGGVALMIAAPFLFFPFSRTLWLAFDLAFRPHE